ncbi:MAG: tRNA guanosine(34) transglycosylase Tgt [Thermomicrobiales bacterium]|jgi:queuine tRNA-ribosyltransferase|nr:tRNA guanosine(34) transglycosylase Tgt [Thermomicrobiales bacterium]
MTPFSFDLIATSPGTEARRGRITTKSGSIETPVFMPVGTQATVKTLDPLEVEATGAEIILGNTYHLMLRPGVDVIEEAGGLQPFMRWNRSILTDSGGFQIFSLAQQAKVREEGVTFRSHIDGSARVMTPESVVDLQVRYGSDIMMPLDHLIGLPAKPRKIVDATARTRRWLERSIAAWHDHPVEVKGALFGICQGGMDVELRAEEARFLAQSDVAGSAIGGLSVGEPKDVMNAVLEVTCPLLPVDRPRYLMGVGSPEDLWNAVARGVDMFDCVLPTRLARNGSLFTPAGRIDILKAEFKHQHLPVDDTCDCTTCARFTRAYIHHLFRARELLGLRLASLHNIRFLVRQVEEMREAIEAGTFATAHRDFAARYKPAGPSDRLKAVVA